MAVDNKGGENELARLHEERTAALAELHDSQLAAIYLALQVAPLRRLFSWAVPSDDALQLIADASPHGVLDVGAGTGFWASLLAARGVDATACDSLPVGEAFNGHHALPGGGMSPPFCPVDRCSAATAAAAAGRRTLLLCWPPSETADADAPPGQQSMAFDALRAFPGTTCVYVGEEPATGACAGPRFGEALAHDGWALVKTLPLPRWPGASDSLFIYQQEATKRLQEAVVEAPWANAPPFDATAAAAQRRAMMGAMDAGWAAAAAAHICGRVLRGGARASPGPEARATAAAAAASPLVKRLLLRALCG